MGILWVMEVEEEFSREFLEKYKNFEKRKQTQEEWKKFIQHEFHATHFITLNFNRWIQTRDGKNIFLGKNHWENVDRKGWSKKRKVEYAKEKVTRWSSRLQSLVLGRDWYKKNKMKKEWIQIVLFIQNVESNLHFHGFCKVTDTGSWKQGLEHKMKKFEDSVGVWNETIVNKTTGENISIVEGGSVWLERIVDTENKSLGRCNTYTLRDETKMDNFENWIICGV